jgi:hypothetical protein
MQDRRELADGYEYVLDSAKITPPEVSEWIAIKRRSGAGSCMAVAAT